jgi:hypothetical protein
VRPAAPAIAELPSMNALIIAQQQHVYGFEGRTSEVIFICGFAVLVLVAAAFMKISFKHWLITGVLFATALTAPIDDLKTHYLETWMSGIQIQRAPIHLAFGLILTAMMLLRGGISASLLPAPSVILLILGVFMATLQFVHDDATIALQSLGFALATIPSMIAIVGRLTRDYNGCLRMVKVLMWVSVIWTFCCSVQFVVNPKLLLNNTGRFWGMLANAQQAAVFCAPLAVAALWLLLNDTQKRTRPLWLALAVINLLFLIWTGSRTGAMMLVCGTTGVLYARVGRSILLLPVAALVLWALYGLSDALQIGANLERFASTDNTRGWVWEAQLRSALESPLIGVGWNDAGGSESSYLGAFAGYGIGALLLVLLLVAVVFLGCVRLIVFRRRLPVELRHLADLYNAFSLMYFAGAAFEGYILARSAATSVMFLMFAGIGKFLLDEIREHHAMRTDDHSDGSVAFDDRGEAQEFGDPTGRDEPEPSH